MSEGLNDAYQALLWDSLLGEGNCAGYNGAVDRNVLNVADAAASGEFNTDIAKRLGLAPAHVELIQYLLCGADLADYGTSPRGCWLNNKGRAWLASLAPYRKELESY